MKKNNIVLCVFACGLLSACDSFKSSLGLDHYQPDEFAIPTNPPLELPPNYKLRPPRTGDGQTSPSSAHVKDQNPADKAQEAIGVKKKDVTKVSPKVEKSTNGEEKSDASIVAKAKASSQKAEKKDESNES